MIESAEKAERSDVSNRARSFWKRSQPILELDDHGGLVLAHHAVNEAAEHLDWQKGKEFTARNREVRAVAAELEDVD